KQWDMSGSFSRPTVLLLNPPVYDFAFYDLYVKPYGLLRIGAWLEQAGYDVVHINALDYTDSLSIERLGACRRKSEGRGKLFRQPAQLPPGVPPIPRQFSRYGVLPESLEQQMRSLESPPDLILVTSGMTYWYLGVREMVRLSRKVFPRVPVGCGGIYGTLMPDHCLAVCEADFVTRGPAWPGLLQDLEARGLPLPAGKPPLHPLVQDPVWRDSAALRLNEGCPFRCDYCASSLISPEFEKGRVQEAVDFVLRLYREKGCRNFAFYDDALLVNWDSVLGPFLETVVRETGGNLNFYNPNALHIRYLDAEKLNLMARAGFREIRMGYESSDDSFQKLSDGKSSLSDFQKAIQAIRDSEFPLEHCQVYVLAGLPGQDPGELEHSIRTAAATGVRCRLAQYSPVPGTGLWEQSIRMSPYPLAEEPLFHNNNFFPLESRELDRNKIDAFRRLGLELFQSSLSSETD
ncbi:MAG: radical SAM protein, partial [Spirochaetales bacterium]|nr:radical SAM protein [Spirochaetales bacterium]